MDRIGEVLNQLDSSDRDEMVRALRKDGYDKNLCLNNDQVTIEPSGLEGHRDSGHLVSLTRGNNTLSSMHFGNILIK